MKKPTKRKVLSPVFTHEETYKKRSLISRIHQNRLTNFHRIFLKYVWPTPESWADFGCSNGFIIEDIIGTEKHKFSKIVGFDHKEELLQLAKKKNILNTEFKLLDLNKIHKAPKLKFDVVTCLETLEHVGDFKKAFTNLFNHMKSDGILIITVPNEVGLPGLVKFIGRMLVRHRPYGNFFEKKSLWKYIWHLIRNKPIDLFREPGQSGYGPHIGFDYRKFQEYVETKYLASNHLELVAKNFTAFRMNALFVFKK